MDTVRSFHTSNVFPPLPIYVYPIKQLINQSINQSLCLNSNPSYIIISIPDNSSGRKYCHGEPGQAGQSVQRHNIRGQNGADPINRAHKVQHNANLGNFLLFPMWRGELYGFTVSFQEMFP